MTPSGQSFEAAARLQLPSWMLVFGFRNVNNIPPVTHEPLSDKSSGNAGTDDQDFASEGSLDRPALLWVGVAPMVC
jgi:hypothetical protein